MKHAYWFGVKYSFACPTCKKLSEEKAGVNSPTDDKNKLQHRINREMLKCQFCQQVPPNGTNIVVEVNPGTLQSLRAAGYPFPPEK
jgi:hypothetical protein